MTSIIRNGDLVINGEVIPWPSKRRSGHSIAQYNEKLYVDGYEWRDGKWRRSLRAILSCLF